MPKRTIAAAVAAATAITLAPSAAATTPADIKGRVDSEIARVQQHIDNTIVRYTSTEALSSMSSSLIASLLPAQHRPQPAPSPAPAPKPSPANTTAVAQNSRTPLFNKINQYRAENGRKQWARNAHLDAQAQRWAEQLVREQAFYHQPGANVWENIAFSPSDPTAAFEQWRKSPAHNRNMLEQQSGSAGIGIAYGYLPNYGWGYISVMQATW